MPLYEYECDACGERFEALQKFSDAPLDVCRKCGKGPVRRLLSSPAIQFKGAGWYITDYAKKGSSDSAASGTKADAKTEAKTESSTETKKADAPAPAKTDTKSS